MTGLIGYNNLAKGATLYANSATLPASNVATDSGSPAEAWQTAAGEVSYTATSGPLLKITPVAGGSVWNAVGLFRTNLTSAATLSIGFWNTSGPTLVSAVSVAGPVAPGYRQVVYTNPTGITADFVQITIDDAANPDGFINVPLVFAGPAWFPPVAGMTSTYGRDKGDTIVRSRGGQEFPTLFWEARRWNIQLESLTESQSWTEMANVWRTADTGQNILLVPDRGSSFVQQAAIFGRLNTLSDFTLPYGVSKRRVQMQVTERL